MADKPIMTDVEINGQLEKFADPQHFTGANNEGRVRTGEKNPLPTANYVQNDSGIWLPVSKDNPIPTQLTGSNIENGIPVKTLKETYSESVTLQITAGVTQVIEEYPFPCELTSFSLGTNDKGVSIRIENKINGSYDVGVRIVHPSGGSTNPVAPSVLNTLGGENDFWSEFIYDDNSDRFAFGMKRVAIFSQGMRIRVGGPRDADVAITYMVTRLEG